MILFVGCCMTWPILFPLNILGKASQSELDSMLAERLADLKPGQELEADAYPRNKEGLDMLSFANVSDEHKN